MWKAIIMCGFYLLFSVVTFANTDELKICLVNNDTLKVLPSSTSVIVVNLINNSAANKNFRLKIISYKGWKCLTKLGPVQVETTSKKIKILSIYVPASTKAGNYEISISAFDNSDNEKIGTVIVPVNILPKYGILLTKDPAPAYIISGDSLMVKYRLQNLSNIKSSIRTTLKNGNNEEQQIYTLAPDSFVILQQTIVAEKNILTSKKQNVGIEASFVKQPETKNKAYYHFDIIPSGNTTFDAYTRYPIKISRLFITSNRNGKREYASMFDARGKGILNEEKQKEFEFHFLGPNRKGESLLGIYDEYFIKYKSPRLKIIVGDNNYNLSYLTEFSRYGRGINLEHTNKKFSVGSFINYPRFYPQVKRLISVYTRYPLNKKYKFNVGYLNKQFLNNTTADLLTVSGVVSPHKGVDLEFEYAAGLENAQFSHAYKTAIKIRSSFLNGYVNYTKADKIFPGYFSNSRYLATGISVRISKKINTNFNYIFNHNNIALDTLYNNAPCSKNLSFFANYIINKTTRASISLFQREREDRMKPKIFHYKEKTIRFSFSKKIKQFNAHIQGESGKTTNYLTNKQGQIDGMYRANFRLQYKLNKSIFINGFATYNNRQLYNTDDNLFWYYGCSVDTRFGEKLSLAFRYQNNYEIEEYYRDRSIFYLNTKYAINRNNEISINGKYNLTRNTLNKKELEIMVKYAHTLNIPVSKKKDFGSLKGKIINNGVENIDGIRFMIGNKMAVSDKKGLFYFPILKKGVQYLLVDYSNAGIGTITETPGPYKLEIIPGADNYFEVTLTKSAIISGNIVIKEDENKGKKEFVIVKEKLNQLIIEAKKDKETFRVYTDNNRSFRFEGLRPGNWRINVYKAGIPEEYELLTEFFNINLEPDQNVKIDVELIKKQRRIKFQKNF